MRILLFTLAALVLFGMYEAYRGHARQVLEEENRMSSAAPWVALDRRLNSITRVEKTDGPYSGLGRVVVFSDRFVNFPDHRDKELEKLLNSGADLVSPGDAAVGLLMQTSTGDQYTCVGGSEGARPVYASIYRLEVIDIRKQALVGRFTFQTPPEKSCRPGDYSPSVECLFKGESCALLHGSQPAIEELVTHWKAARYLE